MHVSMAVFSMAMITGVNFEVNTFEEATFLGCSTFVSYNGIRFMKWRSRSLTIELDEWFTNNFNLNLVLNGVVLVLLLFFAMNITFKSFLLLVPFVMVTLFYMVPFFYKSETNYSLRKIPGIKIFSISMSWAGLVTLFALSNYGILSDPRVWLFCFQQFLFVLVLTLPFDIRDINFDSKKLKTIPMMFGVFGAKLFGSALLVVFSFVSIYNVESYISITNIMISLILLVGLWGATSNQSKYYASFWIEGIPILWWVLLILSYF